MFLVAPAVWRTGHLWIEQFLIFKKMGLSHFFDLKNFDLFRWNFLEFNGMCGKPM